MKPFSKLINEEKVMKNRYRLLQFLQEIVHCHGKFLVWYSFHLVLHRKIFQHRLIYFIHAMKPFSKLTNGEKVMKSHYKLLIIFAKNCASPCHCNFSAWYSFHPAQNRKIYTKFIC